MRNPNRSRWGERPGSERNVAGVGELRAVAERLLETGAQYLDQGREWLHAATRREQGDEAAPRHGAREGFDGARSRFDDVRDDWSTSPRREADSGYGGYASDEYPSPGTSSDFGARGRRGSHDYDDRPAREFDARADALARSRGRPDWGSRQEHDGARRHYGSQPGGFQPHEDDYLPGSYGFGGEGRGQTGGGPAGRLRGERAHAGPQAASARWEQAYRAQGQGSHRGRGPRGYVRSDARILEEVNERLCDDPIVDATEIEVRCEQGSVVLEGKVPTRWMKHRAEDIADSVSGVKDLDNRIQVAAEEPAAKGDFDTRTTTGAHGGQVAGQARDAGAINSSGADTGPGAMQGSDGGSGAGHTGEQGRQAP